MMRIDDSLWSFMSIVASFILAHAIVNRDRHVDTSLERAVRLGLYIASILGLARQLWFGIIAVLLTLGYEEYLKRRRRRDLQ
jgi:hypothetical protein